MNKLFLCVAIVMLLGVAGLFACSGNERAEAEKTAIEKMTDKTATEVVDTIRTPIDNAQSVQKQQEDRLHKMEKTMKD